MINPWLGMLIVAGVFGGLLFSLRAIQRARSPHPELVRKLFHMGMGLFTLSLPLIFSTAWPVLVLTGGTLAALVAIRLVPSLKERFGRVLGGVDRDSYGEIYFAASVGALFFLADGDALLFCVPLLILTLADAVAALIGLRYGSLRYAAAIGGQKSAEGSIAFFLVTFFSVHVPLLLLTETGRAESLLIAVTLGMLMMIFEAVAWRGIDNLFIPLVGFILLKIYLTMSVEELLARLVVTLAIGIFVYFYRGQTTLSDTGLLGVVLIGYLCWALGGWRWMLAPTILFLTYTLLSPRNESNSRRLHNIHAVLSVSSAGLVWLFLERALDRPELFLPYTLAFSAHLAIVGVARLKYDFPEMGTAALLARCVVEAWVLIFLPYMAMEGFTWEAVVAALVSVAGVALAAVGFYVVQPGIDDCPTDGPRWWRQAGVAALGSMVALVPIYL